MQWQVHINTVDAEAGFSVTCEINIAQPGNSYFE
jgi:hypothetical protein